MPEIGKPPTSVGGAVTTDEEQKNRHEAGELVCAWQADARGISNLVDRIALALAEKDAVLADTQRELLNWKSRGPKTVVDALTEAWHKLENVEAERILGEVRPPRPPPGEGDEGEVIT